MNEHVSSWLDGELSNQQARQLPLQLKLDAELRANWDYYHMIGDVLRGMQGQDLSARMCARLEAEPALLAPLRRSMAESLQWRPLQVAASIAAVVFIGGIWMALPGLKQDLPQIAALPAPEIKQDSIPAGEGVREYLLAHQDYSPSNAFQRLAAYAPIVSQEMSLRADRVIR